MKLTKAQQRLVQAAIESFIELNNNDLVKPLLVSYSEPSALKDTYIGFSGTPDLATAQSYVRIDGPRLWIELVLQAGVAYPDKLHYHSIWRDKQADYGASSTNDANRDEAAAGRRITALGCSGRGAFDAELGRQHRYRPLRSSRRDGPPGQRIAARIQ
jgi:hypothetical protein